MRALSQPRVDRNAASRALIELVADVAWAERQQTGAARLQRVRDEAMTLLPMVQRGDAAAARRAVELIGATENAWSTTPARRRT